MENTISSVQNSPQHYVEVRVKTYVLAVSLDRLAVANHVETTGRLKGGASYKRIVGGRKAA